MITLADLMLAVVDAGLSPSEIELTVVKRAAAVAVPPTQFVVTEADYPLVDQKLVAFEIRDGKLELEIKRYPAA